MHVHTCEFTKLGSLSQFATSPYENLKNNPVKIPQNIGEKGSEKLGSLGRLSPTLTSLKRNFSNVLLGMENNVFFQAIQKQIKKLFLNIKNIFFPKSAGLGLASMPKAGKILSLFFA